MWTPSGSRRTLRRENREEERRDEAEEVARPRSAMANLGGEESNNEEEARKRPHRTLNALKSLAPDVGYPRGRRATSLGTPRARKNGVKAGDRRSSRHGTNAALGRPPRPPKRRGTPASQTCAFCPEMEASSSGASISSSSGVDSIVALVVRLHPYPPGCPHARAVRFITVPSASGRWMMTRSPETSCRGCSRRRARTPSCA